jgi:hypothetical protein
MRLSLNLDQIRRSCRLAERVGQRMQPAGRVLMGVGERAGVGILFRGQTALDIVTTRGGVLCPKML